MTDADKLYAGELRERLRSVVSKSNWEAGDIAAEIETSYGGGELEAAAAYAGIDYATLRDYRRVAAAYGNVERFTNLSWFHHRVLAARDDRLDWLAKAEPNGWSVRAMLAAIEEAEQITAAQRDARNQWHLRLREVIAWANDYIMLSADDEIAWQLQDTQNQVELENLRRLQTSVDRIVKLAGG